MIKTILCVKGSMIITVLLAKSLSHHLIIGHIGLRYEHKISDESFSSVCFQNAVHAQNNCLTFV